MAQVPYQPVPTVTPDAAPQRPLNIKANEDMFGAGVGNALSGLGLQLDKDGDKFFATAVKFKQLDIENEVNKATTDFFTQSGTLDNKFRQMEGGDPQKNLDTHTQALTDTRESIRGNLSSDFARKMFDRETMRRLGYDIVNAGSYAATQAKQFNKQTREASITSTIDTMVRDPNNAGAIDDGLKRITELTSQDSIEAGDTHPLMTAKVQDKVGRAVDAVAKTMAKTNPEGAKAFLKKYEDYMHSPQYQETMERVEERGVRFNAEMEGARIATPMDAILDRASKVTKEQESKGDYHNVTTTRDKNGNPQSALGAYGIMDKNLPEWSKQVLGREVSEPEFLGSPAIQDQIYRAKMGEYIKKYGVEGAGRAWLGGEGSVAKPDRADAFGTKVGDYGKVFATKVGLTVPANNVDDSHSIQQMMQDAESSANRLYPDNPERKQQYLGVLQKNILSRVSTQKRELNDHMVALKNSLQETVNKTMPNGRGPTSFLEANQLDPKFADNFEELNRLDPKTTDRIQQAFIKNGKADVPLTSERESNYVKFLGMQDPDFMQQDFNKEFNQGNITLNHANKLMERQAGVKRKAYQNLAADSVLRQNGALLNDAQIFQSRTDTGANERFMKFRGAVIRNLEDYVEEHQAPMPQKEQEEMVKRLTKEVVTGTSLFGFKTNRSPAYEIEGGADVTISSQDDYNKLPPGQHYIWNGQKYKKKAE